MKDNVCPVLSKIQGEDTPHDHVESRDLSSGRIHTGEFSPREQIFMGVCRHCEQVAIKYNVTTNVEEKTFETNYVVLKEGRVPEPELKLDPPKIEVINKSDEELEIEGT